jgi:hypothetical protein
MNNTTALPIDNEWQLINTAPLDRIILLYRPTATKLAIQVAPGKYETNQYAKNPQPYWEVWLRIWNGVTESRAYPPTHWRDYPSPPLPTLELNQGSAAPAPAQPVAEGPTVMEILELHSWLEDEWRANNDGEDLPTLDFARAVLAKWGHPTLQPVAVSERLPGAKDCIKRGNDHWNDDWCWGQERSLLTGQASAKWRLMRVSALTDEAVNWLPANALPIPTPGHFCNQLAHPQPPADGEVRE